MSLDSTRGNHVLALAVGTLEIWVEVSGLRLHNYEDMALESFIFVQKTGYRK
jgi:hypothetical protein